jgi:hypothetical protein
MKPFPFDIGDFVEGHSCDGSEFSGRVTATPSPFSVSLGPMMMPTSLIETPPTASEGQGRRKEWAWARAVTAEAPPNDPVSAGVTAAMRRFIVRYPKSRVIEVAHKFNMSIFRVCEALAK